jgi:hypothetical protein
VTAVETIFFWDVTLCSPVDMYQYTVLKMKLLLGSCQILVNIYQTDGVTPQKTVTLLLLSLFNLSHMLHCYQCHFSCMFIL